MCRRNHSYVFIMNNSVIISPYFGCFTGCISNLTNCKCSWRRDLLNKADIFQNDNDRTSCHAAYIIWNIYVHIYILNILTLFGEQLPRQCLVVLCARRMGPSGFHALSDITWSIVYNAVPEIRLAGLVSVEWFIAINFQFTVQTRSNRCHWNIAYITNYIS